MPYHITKTSLLGSATMYYAGDNRWTQTKDDRKVFKLKKDATAEPFIWGKGWDCKAVKE